MNIVRDLVGNCLYVWIESENYVLIVVGFVFLVSVYVVLVVVCNEVLLLNLLDIDLLWLVWCGLGFVFRSIFGGFVEWEKGYDDLILYVYGINFNGWEKDLLMIFVVINN